MQGRLKSLIQRILALLFLSVFVISNVNAMDLQYSDHTPNGCQLADKAIVLSGSIEPGDNEKISNWIRQNTWYLVENNPPFVPDLQGGNLSEALKIADTFEQLYASAWLPGECENTESSTKPKCSGSCFALVVAAVNRIVSSDTVGLYHPNFKPSESPDINLNAAQKKYQNTFESYINWLQTRQVPAALIEKIETHSSDNTFWLSKQDAALLPETSPEFEQLTVAQCQYEKGLLSQWIDANSSGKSEEAKILREKWDKQSKCLEAMRIDARERWALP
jgi:hypothetical protein